MTTPELHPLAAEVSRQLNDQTGPFHMLVTFLTKPDKTCALVEAFQVPLSATVQETGNLTYRLAQDVTIPEKFLVIEEWKNIAALDAHLKQPYLTQLLADLEEVLAEPPALQVLHPIVVSR